MTASIKTFMTPSPHTIGQFQTLEVADALMHRHHIRHLPVLQGGKLVGVLSQRDLYFVESFDELDVSEVLVDEAMSPEVYAVGPSTPVEEVSREMARRKIGCAVVAEHGVVVGVFTTHDALVALTSLLQPEKYNSCPVTFNG
jgi:acetoin utilization protein AcuB